MKRQSHFIISLILIVSLIISSSSLAFAAKKIKSKSVSLSAKSVVLSEGDIVTLTATMKPANSTDKLKWSSSDSAVATVSKNGTVTAKKEGTATITVKTTSKKTAKCVVAVKKYLTREEVRELIQSEMHENGFANKSDMEASIQKKIEVESLVREDQVSDIVDTILSTKEFITKKEVETLIANASNNGVSSDFVDGEELPLYEGQSLPLTMKAGDITVTIESVSIKQYHYDEYESYNEQNINESHASMSFFPYKRTYRITGSVRGPEEKIPLTDLCIKLIGPAENSTGDIVFNFSEKQCVFFDNHFTYKGESFSGEVAKKYYISYFEYDDDGC